MADAEQKDSQLGTSAHAFESVPYCQRCSDEDARVLRFAQLGLRLLGVMFFVEGAAGVVGSIIYYAKEASFFRDAGYESNPDPYAFGWFAASAISLVAGFYCVTNGRWILEMVFLPSSDESDSEYDAT